MNSASSGTFHTCSSMALLSRASSLHTVPGTTVVIMASEARAVGSRSSSGMMTKALFTGVRRLRSRVQNTSSVDSMTSWPTARIRRITVSGCRTRGRAGRSGASSAGAPTPNSTPSSS